MGDATVTRQLIQKVVISRSADGKSADLELHGRLATILASMAAWEEFARLLREGQFQSMGGGKSTSRPASMLIWLSNILNAKNPVSIERGLYVIIYIML